MQCCKCWLSTASTMFHGALHQPCGIIALNVHSNILELQTTGTFNVTNPHSENCFDSDLNHDKSTLSWHPQPRYLKVSTNAQQASQTRFIQGLLLNITLSAIRPALLCNRSRKEHYFPHHFCHRCPQNRRQINTDQPNLHRHFYDQKDHLSCRARILR